MTDFAIRELACSVVMQAVRDYVSKNATRRKRQAILDDLRSEWMIFLSNGTSLLVAEKLEKEPEIIAERLNRMPKED